MCSVVKLIYPLQLWIKQTIALSWNVFVLNGPGYWFVHPWVYNSSQTLCPNPSELLLFVSANRNLLFTAEDHRLIFRSCISISISCTLREFSSALQSSRKTKGSSQPLARLLFVFESKANSHDAAFAGRAAHTAFLCVIVNVFNRKAFCLAIQCYLMW